MMTLAAVALMGMTASACDTRGASKPSATSSASSARTADTDDIFGSARAFSKSLIEEGRQIFRFDTFGDEAFWGDQVQLQQTISKTTPRQALALGLKIDASALSDQQREAIRSGAIDLDDPAVTVQLVLQGAVLGITGFPGSSGTLRSAGIQCALCHSTVDDSIAPGIGERIDGLTNRDLNIGAIIAASNVQPFVDLLELANPCITADDVRSVLRSWGPGKFDAELFLDGKLTTPSGGPAATLIPNARGLAGFNLHTWTGGWGSIPYWNAMVAVIEMRGVGSFFDERFDDATQFPIAAAAGFGHISVDPDSDRVTSKLGPLQFYQLSLPPAKPRPGVDFDPAAAARGDELFSGKANCNRCHHEPLWTEPGWNQHTPEEMQIDSFQADRSPGHAYKTMQLAGIFVRERGLFMFPQDKGRFYHDGRFATLLDVVESYNQRFGLGLTPEEESDLVEYLKSL